MSGRGVTRRSFLQRSAAMVAATGVAGGGVREMAQANTAGEEGNASEGGPDNEFIQVAGDHWHFETHRSGKPFVPFGSNLVLTSKEDLDVFGPRYGDDRYRRILDTCAGLGMNTLKVFLPVGLVLPDMQEPGTVHPSAMHLDHLDAFLTICKERRIRALVTLSEWHGHALAWWREGGGYFGRRPWKKEEGIDSLEVLSAFWRLLGKRFRDRPEILAYTPCVEWTMPSGNLTPPWAPPEDEIGLVPGETALWYWREWLLSKYESLDQINRTWQTHYETIDAIASPTYQYLTAEKRYADPEPMVGDYQDFREWATYRYFKPQWRAIREVDPNHLVTISNHMRSWNLWEGAARHFLGYTPSEESHFVDFITHHANYDARELERGRTFEDIVSEVMVMARFARSGRPMPVVIEEFTFGSQDENQVAAVQEAMARGTLGHASGWLTWYLQYPEGANAADAAYPSAWLTENLEPTAWGRAARAMKGELEASACKRQTPSETIPLQRRIELLPKETGTLIREWQGPRSPGRLADFSCDREPGLHLRLRDDKPSTADSYVCTPVISGALRQYDPVFWKAQGVDGWRRELDDESVLGFDLLWMANTMTAFSDEEAAKGLSALLDLCAQRQIRVMLDTGLRPSWYNPIDLAAERETVATHIRRMTDQFGDHPAFWAWYVPQEIYVAWDAFGAFIDGLYPSVVEMAKQATPSKPVTLSPFFILDKDKVFGDFRYAEPEEYGAYWAGLIKRSGFDVIMMQDSGEHFSYVTNEQRLPFFEVMRKACQEGGAAFWGNVETAEFECPSIEEYEKQYGRVHHSTVHNAPWRAVPIERLRGKLELAARYCERIVCWGYNEFGRPYLNKQAAAWHNQYRRYYVESVTRT